MKTLGGNEYWYYKITPPNGAQVSVLAGEGQGGVWLNVTATGAGIYNNVGNITLSNSVVSENTNSVNGIVHCGTSVYNKGGSVSLHNSFVSPNPVNDGGTISTTFEVNSLEDVVDETDGKITLREATERTNGDTTVTFASRLVGTIALTQGQCDITTNVAINGDDRITIDAGGNSRIFYSTSTLNLTGLMLTGGKAENGGGIYNYEKLTVTDSIFTGNTGYGIYNRATCSLYGFASVTDNTSETGYDFRNTGTLKGSGYLQTGGLLNAGTVNLSEGTLTIEGNYVQSSNGNLQAIISDVPGVDKGRLVVSGAALLDGKLTVNRTNSYIPDVWSHYVFIQAGRVEGQFASYSGTDVDDPDITAYFGNMVMIVARNFDQEARATFTYESTEENNRVFFDVTSAINGCTEFRIYDPNGQLVFITSASASDPDFGDFGAFLLETAETYTIEVMVNPDESPEYDWNIHHAPITQYTTSPNVLTNGRLATPGSMNVYEIKATPGTSLSLLTIDNIVPTIEVVPQSLISTLRDAQGVVHYRTNVSSKDYAAGNFVVESLPSGGVWTLSIEGVGDDLAAYQFHIGARSGLSVATATLGSSMAGYVNYADIRFTQSVDTESFSPEEDIVEFFYRNNRVAVENWELLDTKTLRLSFAPIAETETLYLTLGPQIYTLDGNAADFNLNGINGETSDIYKVELVAPQSSLYVFYATPNVNAATLLDCVKIYFNDDIDRNSVSVDSIVQFDLSVAKENQTCDLRSSITGVVVNDASVTIYFTSITTGGHVSIKLANTILDISGNAIDQNLNKIRNEEADQYILEFDVTSPNLAVSEVSTPVNLVYGEVLTVNWNVKNTGQDAADGYWWNYIYLSKDAVWDIDDAPLGRYRYDSSVLVVSECYICVF